MTSKLTVSEAACQSAKALPACACNSAVAPKYLILCQICIFGCSHKPPASASPSNARHQQQVPAPDRPPVIEPFGQQMGRRDGPAPVLQREKPRHHRLRREPDARHRQQSFQFRREKRRQADGQKYGRTAPDGGVQNPHESQESCHPSSVADGPRPCQAKLPLNSAAPRAGCRSARPGLRRGGWLARFSRNGL